MKSAGVYSLRLERLSAEQQHSVIRILLSLITSLVLFKYHSDHPGTNIISLKQIYTITILFFTYSLTVWSLVKFMPRSMGVIMLASTAIEIFLITYLVSNTVRTGIPFHLWYIFYVVNAATRYGWQISVLALSASIVSFTSAYLIGFPFSKIDVSFTLGFTGFLLVLAFMFGQISEKQLNYQASLAIVNEFRAELAGLTTSKEVIEHLISRATELLNVENTFFLPAKRGADASEAPGLRSSGTDPVLLSTFREAGGAWNIEEVIKEQRSIFSNKTAKTHPYY